MKSKKSSYKSLSIISASALSASIGASAFLINAKNTSATIREDSTLKPICYLASDVNTFYTSIEKGLEVANSLATPSNPQSLYVIPGDANSTVYISKQCKIGANVTLFLPYSGTDIEGINEDTNNMQGFPDSNPTTNRKNRIIVKKIVDSNNIVIPTLIIEEGGVLKIGGQRRNTNPNGASSGKYTELVLEDNAEIDCHGNIYCMGFVKESSDNNGSKINVFDTGTITQPLVVYDWGSAKYKRAMINEDIFPFNIFDFPQISPLINFYSGSKLEVDAWMYGTSVGDMKGKAFLIGGSSDVALIQSDSSSSADEKIIWKNTDIEEGNLITTKNTSHVLNIDVYGNYNLNSLKLKIDAMQSIDIDSSNYYLPLSYIFNLSLEEGIFNINEKVKFLPNSSLQISKNSTVNINNDCLIYSSNIYNNQKIYNYGVSNAASFINNGKLNINAGFGGHIYAGDDGTNESKVATLSIPAVISKEVISFSGSLLVSANTVNFSFPSTLDACITADSTDINLSNMEQNQTYYYASNDLINYWYLEGYLIYFNELDSSEGYYNLGPAYQVQVIKPNGDTILYDNPLSVRVYTGDQFKILNCTNIEYFKLDDTNIGLPTNTFQVTNSSFLFDLKPLEIPPEPITGITLEYQIQGEDGWNEISSASTIEEEKDLDVNFRVYIKTENGCFFHPDTKVIIKKDLEEIKCISFDGGFQTENAIRFEQDDNADKTYTINVSVTDGLNSNIYSIDCYVKINKPCVLIGTLITKADGNSAPVEQLKIGDTVLTFDFLVGNFVPKKIVYFKEKSDAYFKIISVHFDDGTKLATSGGQSYFDVESLKYINIDDIDYNFIGKKVLGFKNGLAVNKKIVDITKEYKLTKVYEIVTEHNYNFIANNVVTVEPLIGNTNIFKINENLTYDFKSMENDIGKYGLFSYDDVKHFCSLNQFELYNVKFFKVAIGKGLLTLEKIERIVRLFKQYSID